MKQTYIQPVTEQIEAEVVQLVCASPETTYTFNRYGRWGATIEQNKYGNDAWVNEGHVGEEKTVGGFEAVPMGGDDNDDLYSRTNQAFWE